MRGKIVDNMGRRFVVICVQKAVRGVLNHTNATAVAVAVIAMLVHAKQHYCSLRLHARRRLDKFERRLRGLRIVVRI